MRFKTLFIVSVLLFCSAVMQAQETHLLDLSTCLQIASEKNFQMRSLRENLDQARFRLQSATNRFKTRVDLNMTIPSYTETIRQLEDSLGIYYRPIKQFNYSSNLEIRQPLPTDGRFSIVSQIYGIEDLAVDRNTVELSTRLELYQPLQAIYSYNSLQADLKTAELNYEQSQKELTRAELDINYDVSSAFYGLVRSLEREKIAQQTLNAQKETNTLAQNKYRAGVIAEVEALQMEVDLAEELNNHDIARVDRIAQENLLKQLLEIPLSDSIAIESNLSYEVVEVDIDKAITSGLKHRLEIREQEIEKELAEITIDRRRVNGQLTGSIYAYYDLIGVSSDPRSIGIDNSFRNAWGELKRRPANRGISLNISFPIWDWGVNWAEVQAARSSYRRAEFSIDNEKIQVEREIRNTVARLNSSLRRLQLLEKNINLAQKSFDISQKRFARGEIDSQSLALDRVRVSNAYITRLDAYIEYKLLVIDIARKTFYDFEKDSSLVPE
jgi:outer membrane protein